VTGAPVYLGAWALIVVGVLTWPWSGTAWVLIFVALVAAWPVYELARWYLRRHP